MSLILDKINYVYSEGTAYQIQALKDVNLEIKDGQFIGVIGHTGSGKSTLIQHLREALREACALRIRPIFMTTLSTILGMLPIALGLGAGAELRQSMGVVLVGGLTTSTLLTLVVVPLLYLLSEEWKEKHLHKS